MNRSKGFTIIELIVVIAIIAILAAVVMVNVTQYINKSRESAIKASLDEVVKVATQNIIDGIPICLSDNMSNIFISILTSYKAPSMCVDFSANEEVCTSDQWVTASELKVDDEWWCVDSMGNKMLIEYDHSIMTNGSCRCDDTN